MDSERHLPRWAAFVLILVAFNAAAAVFLKPNYTSPDGVGYFSYLWSVFSEGTLSFATIYQKCRIDIPLTRTPEGWLANNWSFGAALLWAPFYEAARVCRGGAGVTDRETLLLANFGSMILGGFCLALLYSALGRIGEKRNRILVALLTLAGTPLFYYSFIDATYAHAATGFASGLFLWFWLRTSEEEAAPQGKALRGGKRKIDPAPSSLSALRWGTLGLLAGVAACVRTQEMLVILAPAWEWLKRFRAAPERRSALWKSAAAMAAGLLIGFSPQLLIWKFLYGSFLAAPAAFNLSWSNFSLGETVFSSYHGLLAWTPLYALASAGLLWEAIYGDWRAGALFLILAGQVLINSFSASWWGGQAFGLRQLTGTSLIAGLGTAYFLRRSGEAKTIGRKAGLIAAGLCSLWTAWLALLCGGGALDTLSYISPRELAAAAADFRPALQAIRQVLATRNTFAPDFLVLLLVVEIAAGLWFWRVVASERPGASGPPSRWLQATLLGLVLFADGKIVQASRGSRPEFVPGTYIEAAQLGDFFKSEAYEGKALYSAKRGEKKDAQAYFSRAESLLPASPATEPWREEFRRRQRENE